MVFTHIEVVAVGGRYLKDKEFLGKSDPYLVLSLNPRGEYSNKTAVAHNAGSSPNWNETFTFQLSCPGTGGGQLFVDCFDKGHIVDDVLGFSVIPIDQVFQFSQSSMNGWFSLFNCSGKPAGEVNLILTFVGGEVPIQSMMHQRSTNQVQGQSYVNEEHSNRMKSFKSKTTFAEIGIGGAAAAATLLSGGLLFNQFSHLRKDHEREENERYQREENERRQREENERYQREENDRIQRVENERFQREELQREEFQREEFQRAELQREELQREELQREEYQREEFQREEFQREENERRQREDFEWRQREEAERRDCQFQQQSQWNAPHYQCSNEWDPIGTYIVGDRVFYQGRQWNCTIAHTSNPTWTPTDAHSLWRAI